MKNRGISLLATPLNQAELLNLGKRGKLEKSFVADIALLDDNLDETPIL